MPSISLHLFTAYCGLNQSTFHASPLAITALPGAKMHAIIRLAATSIPDRWNG